MPDSLLTEVAATYGPLAALAVYLWINRSRQAPTDNAAETVAHQISEVAADMKAMRREVNSMDRRLSKMEGYMEGREK